MHKSYGDVPVLQGFDLELAAGSVAALIGPSGSGKSTFLRCVNHLESIDAGTIEVDGELVGYAQRNGANYELRDREIARRRSRIGVVFQSFNLFPHLTALENVMIAPIKVRKLKRSTAEENARRLLADVGLASKVDVYPTSLSGGQQQRVAIARALAMEPKIMLFDEPTSALDPELVADVLITIKGLADTGMTMLVVTHEIAFARNVADWVGMVADGRIVERGAPDEILVNPRHERTRSFLSHLA